MPELHLYLIPSPQDAPLFSRAYQAELSNFREQIRAEGIEVSPIFLAQDSLGGAGGLVGEFLIPLGQIVGPFLGGIIVAWIQGRAGRKLRLKVGDIELEASTPKDLERLLGTALAVKQAQVEQPEPEQ